MRVLIIGGAGFIGSHLARHYVAEGHEVHLLLRPSSDAARIADLQTVATVHRLLLSDGPSLRACLASVLPTHIFYLAANTASRHDTDVAQARASVGGLTDLLSLIEAAAHVAVPPRFFLRTGSIAEYGETLTPFNEAQRERPVTGYAASIVAGTHNAQAVSRHLPFPVVTARLSLVYGPDQADDFLVPSLVISCLEGQPVVLNRPLDRRDVLHVDDVVAALAKLAEAPISGSAIFNVGSGETVGVAELADKVAAIVGIDPALIQRKPQSDPVVLQLSTEKLVRTIDWAPRISLDQGLARLVTDARAATVAAAA